MKRYIGLFLALFLGLGSTAYAQDSRNGTNAAPQMLIPVDARTLGGGGAVASATGIESVLWNPAGLDTRTDEVQVMLARRNYIADIGINFVGIGMNFGSLGALAVHLRHYAIGEIEVTDEFNMDGTGETFTPVMFTLGASFSRAMTDRINVGITASLVNESFANVGATGIALDAGVQYAEFLGVNGLRLGVAIRNIGTSMKYDGSALLREAVLVEGDRSPTQYKVTAADADMPTVVDLSASYMVTNGLNLGVTYVESAYGPSEIRALASYDFYGYITARGAYTFATSGEGELDYIFNRPAFGATLNLQQALGQDIKLDYGFMPVEFFDANHVFALRAAF